MTYLELLDQMIQQLKEKNMDPELAYKIIMLNDPLIKSKADIIDVRDHQVPYIDKIRTSFNLIVNNKIPLSRINHEVDFYGLKFIVDDNVFAPRIETELLVEKVIHWIKEHEHTGTNTFKVADLGCGTGVICISIKKFLGDSVDCIGIDKSPLAIANALKNAQALNAKVELENIGMVYFLENLAENSLDIIVSNPPYIAEGDPHVDPSAYNWDPHDALFAKDNGLFYYDQILKNAKRVLKREFLIAFEIGFDQGPALENLINKYGFDSYDYEIIKDYAHHDRIVLIKGK